MAIRVVKCDRAFKSIGIVLWHAGGGIRFGRADELAEFLQKRLTVCPF